MKYSCSYFMKYEILLFSHARYNRLFEKLQHECFFIRMLATVGNAHTTLVEYVLIQHLWHCPGGVMSTSISLLQLEHMTPTGNIAAIFVKQPLPSRVEPRSRLDVVLKNAHTHTHSIM